MKDTKSKIHELEKANPDQSHMSHTVIDEQLLPQQRIEGGGPLKKVPISLMPLPLKIFGYLIGVAFLVAVIALFISDYLS